MTLTDSQIFEAGSALISPLDSTKVNPIGVDLTAQRFIDFSNAEHAFYQLSAGESVFVECLEKISLPDNLCARVVVRNRWLRKGLTVSSPVYQPGHNTRPRFLLTNHATTPTDTLSIGDSFASIQFEQLAGDVETPYDGQYQGEV